MLLNPVKYEGQANISMSLKRTTLILGDDLYHYEYLTLSLAVWFVEFFLLVNTLTSPKVAIFVALLCQTMGSCATFASH